MIFLSRLEIALALSLSPLSRFVLSCRVLSCLVLSPLVLSCRVVSCLVVSCLVLSCRVLSCLISDFFLFSAEFLICSAFQAPFTSVVHFRKHFCAIRFVLSYPVMSCLVLSHLVLRLSIYIPSFTILSYSGKPSLPVKVPSSIVNIGR